MAFFENIKEKSNDWKWQYSDYPPKNGLKVFSCFACGGGSTMGYKLAGCEVLGCVEIDKKLNETYVKNHNPKYNFCIDIREFNKIPNDELPTELFNLDILDGSPPCTTFSMAGQREKTWGKEKKFREGQTLQTLDDLSIVFLETARKLKPKYIIIENVEGIIRGEAWSYVQKIYAKAKEIGYKINHYLCKGEDMGIPQTRHRVFFIAHRNDIDFDFEKLNMHFNYVPITYGEVKSGNGFEITKNSMLESIIKKAKYPEKDVGETYLSQGERDRCFNQRYAWECDVCPTYLANAGIYRVSEQSYLSKEDIISVSTFPQDYIFPNNNNSSIGYICGMSVPPVMIKRIINRLLEVIK